MSTPSVANPDVQIGSLKDHVNQVYKSLVATPTKIVSKRSK